MIHESSPVKSKIKCHCNIYHPPALPMPLRPINKSRQSCHMMLRPPRPKMHSSDIEIASALIVTGIISCSSCGSNTSLFVSASPSPILSSSPSNGRLIAIPPDLWRHFQAQLRNAKLTASSPFGVGFCPGKALHESTWSSQAGAR